MMLFLLVACSQNPAVTLPEKILTSPTLPGKMIQYRDVRGYLLRGTSSKGELWIVPNLSTTYKSCAEQQKDPTHTVLLIDRTANKNTGVEYLANIAQEPISITSTRCEDNEKLD